MVVRLGLEVEQELLVLHLLVVGVILLVIFILHYHHRQPKPRSNPVHPLRLHHFLLQAQFLQAGLQFVGQKLQFEEVGLLRQQTIS